MFFSLILAIRIYLPEEESFARQDAYLYLSVAIEVKVVRLTITIMILFNFLANTKISSQQKAEN